MLNGARFDLPAEGQDALLTWSDLGASIRELAAELADVLEATGLPMEITLVIVDRPDPYHEANWN
jgi:hypothetical protein